MKVLLLSTRPLGAAEIDRVLLSGLHPSAVDVCPSVTLALSRLESFPPDLVIVNLPDPDAGDAVRRLQEHGVRIPMVVVAPQLGPGEQPAEDATRPSRRCGHVDRRERGQRRGGAHATAPAAGPGLHVASDPYRRTDHRRSAGRRPRGARGAEPRRRQRRPRRRDALAALRGGVDRACVHHARRRHPGVQRRGRAAARALLARCAGSRRRDAPSPPRRRQATSRSGPRGSSCACNMARTARSTGSSASPCLRAGCPPR